MAGSDDQDTFLLFSDVHFDPFADPSLVRALASSDASAWKGILASSKQTGYSRYGTDTNFALFESALDDMAAKAGKVSTIIYPGDILGHGFQILYPALTGDKSQAGLDSFIQKTVQFFAQEVESRFPKATVIVADGNIDSALGSTGAKPGDPYLTVAAPVLAQTFFNTDADKTAFYIGFSQAGYYAVEPDGPTGSKYIVLNDNLWAAPVTDPGAAQAELAWFSAELADSAQRSQNVQVVAHIPVGAVTSTVATTLTQTGTISYAGELDNSYNDAFVNLELAYSSTIKATFTGHTHDDDFRIMSASDGSGAAELLRISPSISPVFSNNPGYQVFSFSTRTGSLLDETTFTFDLSSAKPVWSKEYTYSETYGQSLATSGEWLTAYDEILTNPVTRSAYFDHLVQGAASPVTSANELAYLLTPGYATPGAFNAAGAIALAGK